MTSGTIQYTLNRIGRFLIHSLLTLVLFVASVILTRQEDGWSFVNWFFTGLPLALGGVALDLLFFTSRLRNLPVLWMKIAVLLGGFPAFYLYLWKSVYFPLHVLLAAVLAVTTLRGQICQWKRLLATGVGLLPLVAIFLYFALQSSFSADELLLLCGELLLAAGVLYSASKYHLLTVIGYSAAVCCLVMDRSVYPGADAPMLWSFFNLLFLLLLFLIRAVTLLPGYTEDPYIVGPQNRYSLYRREDYI